MLLSMKMASVFISMIKTESKLKLCERHPWKSWNKVKIDHYLTTSQFIFQGERNWILSLFQKGKEAQKLLKSIHLYKQKLFPLFLKKLPGFRSNTPLNKYIGSICYTALIAFLLKWMIPFQAPQIALYSISIGCMLLTYFV